MRLVSGEQTKLENLISLVVQKTGAPHFRFELSNIDLTDVSYRPNPIDVSKGQLSPELTNLTERLAENAHDAWAGTLLAQGWAWGEVRDDARKPHPDLIAYDKLSEDERELDGVTATGTLKAILALGTRSCRQNKPLGKQAKCGEMELTLGE